MCVRECLLELCDGGRGPFNEQKLGERRRRKKNACARPERKTDELELIIIITGAPVCVTLKKWHFISKKESSRKIFIRDRAVRFAVYIQFFPFFLLLLFVYLFPFLKKIIIIRHFLERGGASCLDLLVSDISAGEFFSFFVSSFPILVF